jgi:hypothetical protein
LVLLTYVSRAQYSCGVCQRHQPKDPPQFSLGINGRSQSVQHCVEFTRNVMVQIVAFFVMRPCDSADFPMLASIGKHKKMRSENCISFSISVLPLPHGQNKMPGKRRESSREVGNAGEGKRITQDAERVTEELGDPLPDHPTPYLNVLQCVPGMRGVDTAHH